MMLKTKKGSAWIGILFLLIFITSLGLAIVVDSLNTINQGKKSALIIAAQSLCDAGIEKATWELNNNSGYTGEENYVLPNGEIDIVATGPDDNKNILVTAYIPNEENAVTTRSVRAKLAATPSEENVAFNYAVQVGDLGITFNSNVTVHGSVYSNGNITGNSNVDINNDAYAVGNISGVDVGGTVNPGVDPIDLPDFDPDYWKERANVNDDAYNGNYTVNSGTRSLGPKRINGNLVLNGGTLNVTGPIYVTGNITANSNVDIRLDNSFGSNGTVILADGTINLNSNIDIFGTTSSPKGHLLFVTLSSSATALSLNSNVDGGPNNTAGGIFYAPNGRAVLNSNIDIVAIAARGITCNSNVDLRYQQGLASAQFSGGPGGVFRIKEWQVVH